MRAFLIANSLWRPTFELFGPRIPKSLQPNPRKLPFSVDSPWRLKNKYTAELKRATGIDYEERRALWSRALSLFSDFSEHLYKMPGRLVIDIDDTGYRFDVEIAGSPSEGISKMKIFCYDLMLVSFARQRGLGIDFLIHDSTIFDGVDPRQRAHALELAAAMSEKYKFQYICTLNTDMVPASDFSIGFDFKSLVRLPLTDTDPSGSLLGFRY
jgi:uncharacterized protein YydD (DUF2326 family)